MGIEPSENTFLDEDLPDHSLGYVPFASRLIPSDLTPSGSVVAALLFSFSSSGAHAVMSITKR